MLYSAEKQCDITTDDSAGKPNYMTPRQATRNLNHGITYPRPVLLTHERLKANVGRVEMRFVNGDLTVSIDGVIKRRWRIVPEMFAPHQNNWCDAESHVPLYIRNCAEIFIRALKGDLLRD